MTFPFMIFACFVDFVYLFLQIFKSFKILTVNFLLCMLQFFSQFVVLCAVQKL